MRNALAAFAAVLALVCSAHAQTQTIPYNGVGGITGTLTTSGDFVLLNISGGQWATVQWFVVGPAGTSQSVREISVDGGTNWFAAPYGKKTNVVAGNPVVGAALSFTTGDAWEVPLPFNATNFRIRCSSTGTSTTVTASGGTPYVPGVPVFAVLSDVSTTAGAANNTPTLDSSGWKELVVSIVTTTAATGAASLNIVDDAGAAVPIGTSASIAVGTYVFGWGDSGTFGATNPFTMVGGVTQLPLDRRFSVLTAGATTSATRIRVAARR